MASRRRSQKTRTLIVHNRRLLSEAIVSALRIEGIGVAAIASTGAEALQAAAGLNSHVVLLELPQPDIDGVNLAVQLMAGNPGLDVLVVSPATGPQSSPRALNTVS